MAVGPDAPAARGVVFLLLLHGALSTSSRGRIVLAQACHALPPAGVHGGVAGAALETLDVRDMPQLTRADVRAIRAAAPALRRLFSSNELIS
eukprot:7465224-Pyramimonas_sp.AAC.2